MQFVTEIDMVISCRLHPFLMSYSYPQIVHFYHAILQYEIDLPALFLDVAEDFIFFAPSLKMCVKILINGPSAINWYCLKLPLKPVTIEFL
jgi:hypothetical protein